MDEGKLVADFLAKNAEKIGGVAKQAFNVVDEIIRVKIKVAYTEYLSRTGQKYAKAKSFFIRNEAVDLYTYYVPTAISSGKNKIGEPSFAECVAASKRIVFSGSGGSGKSVLLRHLFLDCLRVKAYAPILVELRELNSGGQTLEELINNTLDLFGFNISGDYVKRAKQAGHFCFFLDGFDEVSPKIRKKLVTEITALSAKFASCPIFITSRPDDIFNGIDDFSVYQMLPLTLDAAVKLVSRLPFDVTIKTKFNADLAGGLFKKHQSFLSNPLLLSIMLLTYGENAEIPTKLSIFYNQAYEALFQRHDAQKGGYSRDRQTALDIQDFSRVFSLFSLQTYEKRLFKMPRTQCLSFIEKCRAGIQKEFTAENYLSDLLSAACLLVEDGLEIAFSHRSFQEYFVALYISSTSPDVQEKLLSRYWKNMRSDDVIVLLLELNPDLVERVLFVPILEKMFASLKVTRTVGITHLMRYYKMTYQGFNFESETINATLLNLKEDPSRILHLAIKHCGGYTFPPRSVYNKSDAILIEKYYDKNDHVTHYSIDSLSARSPLTKDMASAHGAFSLQYLSSGFAVWKKLKAKHSNTIQSLDSLLGIRL